jgi:preprotein translocase subunit SecF
MREHVAVSSVRFEPRQRASRSILIVGVIIGPLLWLVVIAGGAYLLKYSWAVALGLLVGITSFIVALTVFGLLRAARVRQEKRYVDDP